MGIFSRLTDIVNANINSLLDCAEDPEKMVKLMIQEMEDTLVEVRSAAVRTITEKKEIHRKLEKLSDAKAKEKALMIRMSTAKKRVQMRRSYADGRVDDALMRFEALHRRIDE